MASEIHRAEIGLEPIAFNYAPNSYVIHHCDTSEVVEEARRLLANHDIHLLGRSADWQHHTWTMLSMRLCVWSTRFRCALLETRPPQSGSAVDVG